MSTALFFLFLSGAAAAHLQAQPPDTDIFLAPLKIDSGMLSLGAPVNITSSPGYDNQPSFMPDGATILFTSGRGGTASEGRAPQTDIYRYDISLLRVARVTETPESEYSPTITPDGKHLSVIRVEADGTQRVWRFSLDGRQPELVLTDVKPVGYHAWVDEGTLVLFVLGQPPTLQAADVRTGKAVEIVKGVGRSIQRIPGGGISFTLRDPQVEGVVGRPLTIMELDPRTRETRVLIRAVAGATEADTAWTPDGSLLMAHDGVLYAWKRGQPDWTQLADLVKLGPPPSRAAHVLRRGAHLAFFTRYKEEHMGLRDTYSHAIQQSKGRFDGSAQERDGKLYFTGTVKSEADKNEIWNAIKTIPSWREDVVADIKVVGGGGGVAVATRTYTVKAGDTLSKIAKEHLGNANAYMKIFEANRDQLTDPDQIRPGQVLKIPG